MKPTSVILYLRRLRVITVAASLLALAACGDSSSSSNAAATPSNPSVEGPIAGAPTIISTFFDLEAQGYQQAEYFIAGTADSYTNVNELTADGEWQVEANEQAEFQTRIVVYRPIAAADFNGTVVVEWLNVSAGFDTSPDWGLAHTEFIRQGYAWVGVSAQQAGVNNLIDSGERYSSLSHPGDSFSYDIYAQIAQGIKNPTDIAPLGDLIVERLIGAGESQSASRMLTYANILGNSYDIYDGFFIHSRYNGSAALAQSPQVDIVTPDVVRVRADLNKPVLMLQTESDVVLLESFANRQDDSDTFRLWEAAGTSHADLYTGQGAFFDTGSNPDIAAVVESFSYAFGRFTCAKPINSGPHHFIVKAAFAALNQWLIDGTPPPIAERLSVTDDGASFIVDSLGIVEGGIRSPYVDAPVAVFTGTGEGESFCRLFGTTELFDSSTLGMLYSDNDAYIEAVNAATDRAVADGFILPADSELIKTYVAGSDIFAL